MEKNIVNVVPIVQEFPNVFPKDLSGVPLKRQLEFRIDLVLGAAPIAKASCNTCNLRLDI